MILNKVPNRLIFAASFIISLNKNKMRSLLLIFSLLAVQLGFAQQSNLRGTVIDEHKDPIPFASVNLMDSSVGTAADADGKFLISLPYGTYSIKVSSMGYTP